MVGKKSKYQLSLALCCNADGSEMQKPLGMPVCTGIIAKFGDETSFCRIDFRFCQTDAESSPPPPCLF